MLEAEQYIEYIKAIRATPAQKQKILASLKLAGFEPSSTRLAELLVEHSNVYQALFNQAIIVVVATCQSSKQVYIEQLPIYDQNEHVFKIMEQLELDLGEPKSKKAKVDNEQVKDVAEHQTVEVAQTIELSQELWEKLAWWNMDFLIIDRDVKFVDAALKIIGYVNGLNGIFSKEQIAAIGNEKYTAILDLLSSEADLINSKLEGTEVHCEADRQLEKQQFVKNAIQILFDKAKSSNSPVMVNAAWEGMRFALELQNNFNVSLDLPSQPMPPNESLHRKADLLIAYGNSVMDHAFKMSEQFRKSTTSKPNDNNNHHNVMKPD